MRPDRVETVLQGCTVLARKVFDAVPIAESWTPSQIRAEMLRQGHSAANIGAGLGCLGALEDSGLVSEQKGLWVRCKVREKSLKLIESPPPKEDVPVASSTALENLSRIAQRLADTAKELQALGAELEVEALRVSADLESKDEASVKLDQLRVILKGIG